MFDYCGVIYQRVKRSFDLKKIRDQWLAGELFINKNENFEVYEGGNFDDVVTLFAKEKFWTKEVIKSKRMLLLIEPTLGGLQ